MKSFIRWFVFYYKNRRNILQLKINSLFVHHQFPPRLSTMRTTVGLRFLCYYMKYSKRPINIPLQLEILKQRGLIFKDEDAALEYLHSISYFRLANYWRQMENDKSTHQFYPNSYFEDIINIYLFDKKLRSLIFIAIQDIEVALRTRIIHFYSLEHGVFWFMDKNLFKDQQLHETCLANIQKEINRSNEEFLKEHFAKYDEPEFPPVWKVLEVVSFGTLSKLFYNIKDTSVKKKVAKSFHLPQYIYLESWIKSAVILRNACAHHSRLWNKRFPWKPQLPQKLPSTWLKNVSVRPFKLYAQLCYLVYLEQSINPNSDFKNELKNLLLSHTKISFKAMGFPDNWQSEPLWR